MNEERIENQLRAWLADEAGRIEVPAELRERVGAARTVPAARRWAPGWSVSLPRPLLAGVAGLLVVVGGASLVLSGVLPIGRADCSGVSVDSVRAAAEGVPGYTYRMRGTELLSTLRSVKGELTFEYVTGTVEFAGAYRAPDAWSLEVISVEQGESPIPPSIGGFLISEEWDAYIVVQEDVWSRPRGAEAFARMPASGDISMTMLGANRLTDLLAGEAFRWTIRDEHPPAPLRWTVEAEEKACRLISTNDFYAEHPEVGWQLDLLVDPATHLPAEAEKHLTIPEIPFSGDTGASATDVRMEFTFDYSAVPEITPPTNPQILPVSEQQARDDADGAGSGLVVDIQHSALGATDVFVARGVEATAVLVYEEGVLESERIVEKADDVVVEAVEGMGGRFLVVVVNDFRVSRVEVDYSIARTDEFESGSARIALEPFPERKGEILTWRAYDTDGNELVLNPRPPDI